MPHNVAIINRPGQGIVFGDVPTLESSIRHEESHTGRIAWIHVVTCVHICAGFYSYWATAPGLRAARPATGTRIRLDRWLSSLRRRPLQIGRASCRERV